MMIFFKNSNRRLISMTRTLSVVLFLVIQFNIYAQNSYTIKGHVIDAKTSDPIPYASVYIEGTTTGTLSDINGVFNIPYDGDINTCVIIASFMGYTKKQVKLNKNNITRDITIKLKESAQELDEVVIKSKKWENPAWPILRSVQDNKNINDKTKLKSYQYESYTKTDIWVGNVNENFKQKKVVKDILDSFDNFEQITDETGQPIIPIFSAETHSNLYFIKNPNAETEEILKSRIRSLGPDDDEMVSQIVGSSFVDFNLYRNSFLFLNKSFISPITSEWRNFYDYTLQPKKVEINGISCHEIDFEPRRVEDLAFYGTIYIADSVNNFALVKIDATLGKGANINFVDSVHIDQEYSPILQNETYSWLPQKQNFTLSVGKIADKWAKVKIHIKVSNKNFIVDKPKPRKFYEQPVIVDTDAYVNSNAEYWNEHRPEKLSIKEEQVFSMIDSAEDTPRVKLIAGVGDMIISGHKKIGKIELGPIPFLYANNSVESSRFQLGFRTNNEFSNKIALSGFAAYGTKDKEWKYGGSFRYITNREKWSIIGVSYYNDLRRVSVNQANFNSRPLFIAALRWGDMRYPYMEKNASLWYETDITRGLNVIGKFSKRILDPLFPYKQEGDFTDGNPSYDRLNGSELYFKLTYGLGHKYVATRGHKRKLIAQDNTPRFTIDYTLGLPDFLGSNYGYQQIRVGIDQKLAIGKFGTSAYVLSGGIIPTKAPFPMLAMPFGNNVPVLYNKFAFNLMNLGEFVGDKWASLQLMHRFEGNILNRIPLIKKLGWRTVGICNIMYGELSPQNSNQAVHPQLLPGEVYDPSREAKPLQSDLPYVEVGTGVENIFKVMRVYTIWRTTYHTVDSRNFGVYVAFGLSF
ncbi:carboxypeptidase-like regulatory domain-containing protein [Flammeovirga kamogawensis]|nr:carboxypeptidase-like regulatory domain-containing protein [Flammeovirga kamogawensis]